MEIETKDIPPVVKPKLNKDQVEMAKLFVEDLHPISKTSIDIAFPYLFCWYGAIRKCFKSDHDEALHDQPKSINENLLSKIQNRFGDQVLSKEARKMKRLKEMQSERDKLAHAIEDG